MAYSLIITDHANKQIDNLVAYLLVTLQNPQAAVHFLDELEEIYIRLESNPFQFHLCKDLSLPDSPYRSAVFSSMRYHIIFRVQENTVYILAAFHSMENVIDKMPVL